MKFINKDPLFLKHACDDLSIEFYYKGIFDQPLERILNELRKGSFPHNLKGNFAFYYKDKTRIVIAVDHLPSYNLFYNNDHVSHIFTELCSDSDQIDKSQLIQRDFFWGGTVGTRTTTKNISRLEAGCFYQKNLSSNREETKKYIDLYTHHIDDRISINDISKTVEQIIEEKTREPFNLFLSSGTDSNAILGFIKKLKRIDLCFPISLYSKMAMIDEFDHIKYLEGKNKIQSTFYEIGDHVGVTKEILSKLKNSSDPVYIENFKRTWNGFWWEPNIMQKYTALYDLNRVDKITLTGEVGDQIFGSRFSKVILKFLVQYPEASSNEIASLFTFSDLTRFKNVSVSLYDVWNKYIESDQDKHRAYYDAIDWVDKIWSQTDTGDDIINRIEILQYFYKASHRCFNYNQLAGADFLHPFSDYRLFHIVFKTPGLWKLKNGKTRRLSYEIIKDYVDSGPWYWPKSGISLPMKNKSNVI